ncbi:MAG: hypothetical protein GY913_15235 [Proteobacteria bacterium]|nr:hypothetical protein [Pseudomonadota bacterium]MCP4918262.1 hypothetical protein [Pseudomonadota bacterium]
MRKTLLVSTLLFGGAAALASIPEPEVSLHPRAQHILDEQVADWEAAEGIPESYTEMRQINAEWDFMARTFLVLSLANLAVAEPENEARYLGMIDALIADTLAAEAEHGQEHFLMPYGRNGGWEGSGRSIFVDGEIALMITARRTVASDRWEVEATDRVQILVDELEAAPEGLVESYPDEGWTFCHSMALAAIRLHDHAQGTDHSELVDRWVENARRNLIDRDTGLLVSSFERDGDWMDGPEGSTIWLTAVNLRLLHPELAQSQYDHARTELGGTLLGMGYAREWPASWVGHIDVDSGPIVPGIDASPSSSGFALLASAAFDDAGWNRQLVRAFNASDAIIQVDPTMAAMADNAVGDAVLLYAFSFGPLWDKVGPYPS